MRVLLTGATGFIGRNLAPVLRRAGCEVIGVGRQGACPLPGEIGWFQWDLAAGDPPRPLPEAEAIIHLAHERARAPEGTAGIHAIAGTATLRLLEHARRGGAGRFVLGSTGNVYGFADRPFTEADAHRPAGIYAAAKCYAESLVESFEPFVQTAILRLFAPYGPGQMDRMIPDIVSRVRESRPVVLKGGGQPRITPVFIEDVCTLVLRVLAEPSPHLKLNIAGDEHAGPREIAAMAAEVLGVDPVFELSAEAGCGDLMGDNRAMKAMLGAPALVPLREGLRRTILGCA